MNKGAIKSFAIWARNKLMADVKSNLYLIGIREDGIQEPLPQSTTEIEYYDIGSGEPYSLTGDELKKRAKIISRLQNDINDSDYKTAYSNLIEHTASTWFNRLCAIRFMEVNEYFDDGLRVLSSSEEGKRESDLMASPFESDIVFTDEECIQIRTWKLNNKNEELFAFLLGKKCKQLSKFLPGLFEKEDDCIEMLVRLSIFDKAGIIDHLVNDIDEEDWREQVQIIGWLYQFYTTEKHEAVVSPLHGKVINKEDIPAATQLFTTDWVVRYILDNSLGRFWIERHPESMLAEKLTYYVIPKEKNTLIDDERILPEEIKVFDPCVGSGHFLAYAFDILMEIYRECGWLERDAARSIIENNLYGLDIDDRATQLACFSLMMKAREYNRHVTNGNSKLHILAIQESTPISDELIKYVSKQDSTLENDLSTIRLIFENAKEYGSIIEVPQLDFKVLYERVNDIMNSNADNIIDMNLQLETKDLLLPLIYQAELLAGKYEIVATNPPYMNRYSGRLKTYIGNHYGAYKGDLFSVFMYRNFGFCKPNGYSGFMTPLVWMFIKSYEPLREFLLSNKAITTLIQFEYSAFEEATVPICSFVLKNGRESTNGCYFNLSSFRGGMEVQRRKVEYALLHKDCGYYYEKSQTGFSKIPGKPIAYWNSEKYADIFVTGTPLDKLSTTRQGMIPGNVDAFLRTWFEVSVGKIGFNHTSSEDIKRYKKKWFPYNKGGAFRRWYGNILHVINMENDGYDIRHSGLNNNYRLREPELYFKEAVTWSKISSGTFSTRIMPKGNLFDIAGCCVFDLGNKTNYVLGFTNSVITSEILNMISPTLNYEVDHIKKLPIIIKREYVPDIDLLVNDCIRDSKTDWDSFETSWDFKRHPLAEYKNVSQEERTLTTQDSSYVQCPIEYAYTNWMLDCDERFGRLKANEEELNRIFIDIYDLYDVLTPEVPDEDVTVRRANLQRDIKSFISYAVGCMFGRYSLDVEGLAYAGGDWSEAWESKYESFIPDEDNCIPITDENYFPDDIVGRFVEFVRVVYGDETLEENLQFISDAIGGKGEDSRDVIRRYFLNDFFKDHCKTYSVSGSGKRPIYWLFDSGKQNGFKALVYMHRWDANTIATARTRYVAKVQEKYENELRSMDLQMEHMTDPRQKASLQKRKEKITKQVAEIRKYDELIGHMALEYYNIDLDDGVKVNHEKVQIDRNGDKYQILAPIK